MTEGKEKKHKITGRNWLKLGSKRDNVDFVAIVKKKHYFRNSIKMY